MSIRLDPAAVLPTEIHSGLLSYLDARSLARSCTINKQWGRAIKECLSEKYTVKSEGEILECIKTFFNRVGKNQKGTIRFWIPDKSHCGIRATMRHGYNDVFSPPSLTKDCLLFMKDAGVTNDDSVIKRTLIQGNPALIECKVWLPNATKQTNIDLVYDINQILSDRITVLDSGPQDHIQDIYSDTVALVKFSAKVALYMYFHYKIFR